MRTKAAKTAKKGGASSTAHQFRLVGLYFVYLYVAWFMAWYAHRHLWAPNNWLDSGNGTFWYWVVIKIVFWIIPALWVIKKTGQKFNELMGFAHIRDAAMWGGGLGILLIHGLTWSCYCRCCDCIHNYRDGRSRGRTYPIRDRPLKIIRTNGHVCYSSYSRCRRNDGSRTRYQWPTSRSYSRHIGI